MEQKKNPTPMLIVLFGSAFIAAFNENIINVALTDIMATFAIDANTANWLVTGFMIVTAVVVTVVAFLLRRFNLRTVFFGGSALLIIGSALAMVAPTFPLLLACRLLQAVGTGVFIPTMMNTILAVAPRRKLGTYLSIGGCCITFGPAFGPVVSGLMIGFFGWRGIFVVPLVAIIVVTLAGFKLVYNFGERKEAQLDIASLLLSICGLTSVVYGLSQITANAAIALIALSVGLALVALFAYRQKRLDDPMLNLRPLSNPLFSLACVLVVVAMMTTFSMSVLLPLYFQGATGTTALVAGALILIPILGQAITSILGGRIMDTKGEWPLLPFGFLLMAAGLLGVSTVSGSMNIVTVVVASTIAYAGVGLSFSPSQTAGLKQLPREMNPFGVGIMSTFIQISAALGPSLFVGILSSGEASAIASGTAQSGARAAGFSSAITVASIIAILGCIVAFAYARMAVHKQAQVVTSTAKAGAIGAAQNAPAAAALRKNAAKTPAQVEVRKEWPAADFNSAPTLNEVMKKNAYTVKADAPVYKAIDLMLEHHTSGLPVINDEGSVVGFVSDGDIMKSLADQDSTIDLTYSLSVYANDSDFDERMEDLMHTSVMDIATHHVISVDVSTPIERACTILGERRIKKVPVLNNGVLAGTISRTDVNRYLMTSFAAKGRNAAGLE